LRKPRISIKCYDALDFVGYVPWLVASESNFHPQQNRLIVFAVLELRVPSYMTGPEEALALFSSVAPSVIPDQPNKSYAKERFEARNSVEWRRDRRAGLYQLWGN
jgi:hypothetical protein